MKNIVFAFLLAFSISVNAATYYISSAGSDANNGTSTATPWAHHPYMRNFTGAYTHAAGDRFIFRGGDSWGNACFTMQVMAGGTPSTPDYYGVDQTWFTGATWTRPVFDAGGAELAGGYDVMVLCNLASPPNYIAFDSLDMRNVFWTGPKSFSQVAYFNLSQSHDITITNCWMHNWTHGVLASGTSDIMKVVIGSNSSPFNPGCLITGCLIDGENADNATQGTSSGEGTYAYSGDIVNTTVRNAASGFIVTGDPANHTVPQVVSGCDIGPSLVSFDPGEHPDGLFMNGGNLFHWFNNYIHDCQVEAVFAGEGSGDEDTYIWNNVVYANPTHAAIEIDTPYNGARLWIYNNTLVSGANAGVRVVGRPPGQNLGVLDFRNNFVVSDVTDVTIDGIAGINNYTNQNTVLISSSSAAVNGYVLANRYAPDSAFRATVGAGQDLSALLGGALTKDILGVTRPQGLAWDSGAYEFTATGPAGQAAFSVSAQTVTETSGFASVTVVRGGGTSGAVGVTVSTLDGTAVAGHDYTAATMTFNWADGETGARSLSVPILNSGDTATTNREFTVNLSNPTGGLTLGTPAVQTITVQLNSPPPPVSGGVIGWYKAAFSIPDVSSAFSVTLKRSGGTNSAASVDWHTLDGSAKAGLDYTASSGTISWGANENGFKFTTDIPILTEGRSGSPISFSVVLDNPTGGAVLSPAVATITIMLNPAVLPTSGVVLAGRVALNGIVGVKFQ